MPNVMESVYSGAKVQDDLAHLSNLATQGRQQNEIRQHEVDAMAKLSAIGDSSTSPQTLEQAAIPSDVDADYAELFSANKKVAESQANLKGMEEKLKVAAHTKEFDKYKALYDLEKGKVEEAQKTKDALTTKHLGALVSSGLSIDPQTGVGYEQFRDEFIRHDLAAARSNGVPEEGLQRRKAFLEQQLPTKWDAKAKVGVSEVMKHSQDVKTQLEIQKIEDARTKAVEQQRIDKMNAEANKKRADVAVTKEDNRSSGLVLKDLEKELTTKSTVLAGLQKQETQLLKLQQANPDDTEISDSLDDIQDQITHNRNQVNDLTNQVRLQREIEEKRQAKNPKSKTVKTTTYTSAEDVRAAYKAGTLTKEEAKKHLKQFGY